MTGGGPRPALLVLAGVNGAGKSSVAGARLRAAGLTYYDPDEATALLRRHGMADAEANAAAWRHGHDGLAAAIAARTNYAIETTLGGRTLPALIAHACASHDVTLWFVGLDSPERHIARVAARVAAGGHAIDEERIRQRYDSARRNLIALLPRLHELWVYDNSVDADDAAHAEPRILLHCVRGRIMGPPARQLRHTPDWAKPLVEAARRLQPAPGKPTPIRSA